MIYYIGKPLYNFKTASLEDMYNYCKNCTELGIDIETTRKYKKGVYDESVYSPGLDPYVSNILMLQIGTLEKQFIIDCRQYTKEELQKYVNPLLLDKRIVKVGHNLSFEGMFFLEHLNCRMVNVWDTMICEKVLYNGYRHSYSLQALMQRYLNILPVQKLNLFDTLEDNFDVEKIAQKIFAKQNAMGNYISDEEAYELAEEELLKNQFIDKSIRLEFVNLGKKPFTKDMIEYGKDDIVYPLKIKAKQEKGRLVSGKLWKPDKAFRLENKFTQVLAEATWLGICFDPDRWKEAYEKALVKKELRKQMLDDYVIKNYPKYTNPADLFSNKKTCRINWGSSKQVIELFKELGIAKQEKSKSTKKLEWTVGAKTLFKDLTTDNKINFYKGQDVDIVDNQTLTLQYLLYKKSEQLTTTFGLDWLRYVHPVTGRIHSRYNQFMISSRLSSTSPNIQQIPNTKEYRRCFTGNLINADFSAQEIRLAAEVHNVQKMIDFFAIGDPTFGSDFHSFNATQMFRVAYNDPDLVVSKKTHPDERDKSKSLTFLLNYGGSAYSLAGQLGVSEEESEDLMSAYFKGLPGMEESFREKKKEAVEQGWIQLDAYTDKRYFFPDHNKMKTLINQAYSLTEYNQGERIPEEEKIRLREETDWSLIWREYMYYKGKIERRSLNLRIQGAAATMTKLAGILLYNYRWENNVQDKLKIAVYVHDEILAEVCDDNNELYAKVIEEKMALSGTFLLNKVPMEAEAVISDVWEH